MRGIVVIDDAGTPGAVPESETLHADRKSWAAVLVHPRSEEQVRHAMCIFTDGVGNDFGVNELHFPEIYGGRGAYKDVSIEKRYELFGLMSELFRSFRLPIFFQTMSSAFLAELHTRLGDLPQRAGWFSLQKVEHVGLLLLLVRVRSFLKSQAVFNRIPLPVTIDEGLVKSDGHISVPRWADTFAEGKLKFRRSHDEVCLQLADFAAFSIARTQWLLSTSKRKPRDEAFLRAVAAEHLEIVNLAKTPVDLDSFTAADYADALMVDRLLKGLPDAPPRS